LNSPQSQGRRPRGFPPVNLPEGITEQLPENLRPHMWKKEMQRINVRVRFHPANQDDRLL
jgi:hypothetical protein